MASSGEFKGLLAALLMQAQTEVEETKLINLLPKMSAHNQNLNPIPRIMGSLYSMSTVETIAPNEERSKRCKYLMKKVVEVLMNEPVDEKLESNKAMLKAQLHDHLYVDIKSYLKQ
eukprot:829428_1